MARSSKAKSPAYQESDRFKGVNCMAVHASSIIVPRRIERLVELTYNLWWSWHPQGRDLFRMLDYGLWKAGGHNPVKILRETEGSQHRPDFPGPIRFGDGEL
jgi:hypothetical protein